MDVIEWLVNYQKTCFPLFQPEVPATGQTLCEDDDGRRSPYIMYE